MSLKLAVLLVCIQQVNARRLDEARRIEENARDLINQYRGMASQRTKQLTVSVCAKAYRDAVVQVYVVGHGNQIAAPFNSSGL